ncbi:uncharacterized protein (TIGR02594 family) [Angulomicrobium tetraedrale]|uniref:Uncharacterized protein (TIGR02594 family) n=1 Tax=Ancylobacter tetraedralis TaxID=217068 RepID=A0A839ZEA7_9HYPH|nr:TIGR02594 family protein [Ancylobacter tetraedralis]MBB3773151.1 uncharacterized protein (TIGR02594 family) [Ancylobacter tetraedralis]
MHEIIDVPQNVAPFARRLADSGVKTVIRYYTNSNSSTFPSKCLSAGELAALHAAGVSVAVVFQQRGGAGGSIGDLSAANGTRDGRRALELATALGQPHGSAVYFAVDHDYTAPADLGRIADYFRNAGAALGPNYQVGAYGSGTVTGHLKALGHIAHVWLAGATGWSGTRRALEAGEWSLFQNALDRQSPIGGFGYDGNIANPALGGFGQFGAAAPLDTPRGVGAAALFRVAARSGLNLRAGPGESFRSFASLPADTLVRGLGVDGDWIKVDLDGDGLADGHMFARFLAAVSGGLPASVPLPAGATIRRPIDVARAELAQNVAEIPGPQAHPRILMYHATTTGRFRSDETAWCSSFVNYCVEQAGMHGTDSAAARYWHDTGWGRDVTAAPMEGDIVVFSRTGGGAEPGSGHVGFYLDADASSLRILGGNQGNRISIGRYPKDGQLGSFHYKQLSIRRG